MDHAHHHDHHHMELSSTITPTTEIPNISTSPPILASSIHSQTQTSPVLDLHEHTHVHQQHDDHQMQMYFHGGCEEVILFDCWRTESFLGVFFSCILIFLMGAFYEGVKWFRVYFQLWTGDSSVKSNCVSMSFSRGKQQGIEDALIEKSNANSNCPSGGCVGDATAGNTLGGEVYVSTVISTPAGAGISINRWTWLMMYISRECTPETCKLIETAIYAFQLLLAYWLMLIAMTFNIYLTAAVIGGAAFGHWLFANIKCAPPRRCYCSACCDGSATENVDNFASDPCH